MKKFAKVTIDVIRDETLSGYARLVYTFLCTYADFSNPHLPVYPNSATIANNIGLSHTTVKLALKELQDAKVIIRKRRFQQASLTFILK